MLRVSFTGKQKGYVPAPEEDKHGKAQEDDCDMDCLRSSLCRGMQISYMWCVATPCQGESSLVSANTGCGSMAMQTQWNTNKEMREKWRLVFGRNTAWRPGS